MAAAPARKKTTSELYTATRDAERLYSESATDLEDAVRQLGDVADDSAKGYIKKLIPNRFLIY